MSARRFCWSAFKIYSRLRFILFVYDIVRIIHFTEQRLFVFARGVSGNVREDDFAGAFIAGHLFAEIVYLFLRTSHTFIGFHDGGGNFAQALVGQTDDGYVLYFRVLAHEVFYLYGV